MGKIFGAYTDIIFNSPENINKKKSGNGNSFVFSLRDDSKFVILKCKDKENEVYIDEKILC